MENSFTGFCGLFGNFLIILPYFIYMILADLQRTDKDGNSKKFGFSAYLALAILLISTILFALFFYQSFDTIKHNILYSKENFFSTIMISGGIFSVFFVLSLISLYKFVKMDGQNHQTKKIAEVTNESNPD